METLCPAPVVANSSWFIPQEKMAAWTKEENKQFESALAYFDEKTPNRWFKVAEMIPGKSVNDVMNQYRKLVADVSDIEAGLVPIPGYLSSSFTFHDLSDQDHGYHHDACRKRSRNSVQERRKGIPWTEEEHRRFLLGLEKHGKGDWRNISRNFVISKTPTQVASHAQKYYLRQINGGKDKRRPSIHDIKMVHDNIKTSSLMEKLPNDLGNTQKCDRAGLMVLGSDYGDQSFIAYPCNVPAQSHYLVDSSANSSYIQASRQLYG